MSNPSSTAEAEAVTANKTASATQVAKASSSASKGVDTVPDHEADLYDKALGYLSAEGRGYQPQKALELLKALHKKFPDGDHDDEVEALLKVLSDLRARTEQTRSLEKQLAQKDAALEKLRSALLN